MIEEEIIIRDEARDYYENSNIDIPYAESSEILSSLKYRLSDFYSSEFKAIFLDDIQIIVKENLFKHRKNTHGGNADPNC